MPTAIVVLTGSEGVSGSLTFTADGASTHLTGEITGLAPGKHGLHVHQELGRELLERVAEDVKEHGKVENIPKLEGRQMTMMIGPMPTK